MQRWVAMFTLSTACALAFMVADGRSQAQEDRFIRIDTLNVRDTLYHLGDGGANALALIDEINGGVILVGAKLPGWGQPVLDAVYQVTDLPVTTIINTHADADHTGSNGEFPDVTDIVAHENTRANMARMELFAGGAPGLPTTTFTDRFGLLEDLDRIELYHFGPGPHRRGRRGGVPAEADRVSRRPVPGQGGAVHRHRQRRERRCVPRDAGEGGGGRRRGRPGDHRPRTHSDDLRRAGPARPRCAAGVVQDG